MSNFPAMGPTPRTAKALMVIQVPARKSKDQHTEVPLDLENTNGKDKGYSPVHAPRTSGEGAKRDRQGEKSAWSAPDRRP